MGGGGGHGTPGWLVLELVGGAGWPAWVAGWLAVTVATQSPDTLTLYLINKRNHKKVPGAVFWGTLQDDLNVARDLPRSQGYLLSPDIKKKLARDLAFDRERVSLSLSPPSRRPATCNQDSTIDSYAF